MAQDRPLFMSPTRPGFQSRFLLPQHWGIWIGLGLLWLLCWLPWRVQLGLGRQIGHLGWALAGKRRRDTLTNLALCFPELDETERVRMGREVFVQASIGLFESLRAWWRPDTLKKNLTISGVHHVIERLRAGQGVLVLGGHYTLLDLGGLLCSQFFQADIVYRPQNNPLLEWLITRVRQPIYGVQIDHDDVRTLVRSLKAGHAVWYTPDQDFGLTHGVMAPFFGVPAATVTAQRRLARMAQCPVLLVHFYRQDDRRPHYHVTFTPVVDHYPSGDELADATRINQLLEGLIRIAPTQYMWFHRRFKTQPAGQLNPYQRRDQARQ